MIATPEQPLHCLSLSLCSLRSFAASCAAFSQPYGNDAWVDRATKRFAPESVFRPRCRPYKEFQNNGSGQFFHPAHVAQYMRLSPLCPFMSPFSPSFVSLS
jgi:hypothetical protein